MNATSAHPREGMMAVVRHRRAIITGVRPYDADDKGRYHLVEVEYTDGLGAESEELLWEVEPGPPEVLEPAALPDVHGAPPMDPRELDAMVRAARWTALTPTLPFSGLAEDAPPVAGALYGAVQVEPYQLVPVLRSLEMPRVSLMLADAVGLGKTIQAGMILRELMLRRRIRRVLVLCPASLRTQWRDELEEKFSIPFQVVDRPHTLALQRQLGLDASPWRAHERIIASYHYLKQPDVLEQFRTTAEPGTDGTLRWDLLIVDEAHNLAPASFGRDSDLSQLLQRIAPWFEHRLFLTATPHNGHTRSFSGLLEALDPVRFTRKSELDEEDRARVGEVVIRRLKSEINRWYERAGEAPRFSRRDVKALPPLRFGAPERALHEAFADFRKAVRRVARGGTHAEKTAGTFALEVLQKRILSGPWAFGQSWLALVDGLEQGTADAEAVVRAHEAHEADVDDDAERESRQRHAERTVGAWLRRWKDDVAEPIAAVSAAVERLGLARVAPGLEREPHRAAVATAAAAVQSDARLRALEALIDERLRRDGDWSDDERLVVFTEYLASLDYLVARLHARYGDGALLTLVGGMDDRERDAVKRAFNDRDQPVRVLLATDAAGEGLNLQRSCRLLLHWDIPWNPGKMEQRNGRLDRHGQERDVEIFHFDSTDDASMRFLGKVLDKRSRTREDRVATDELFASAILAHFEHDEDPEEAERRLDRGLATAQSLAKQTPDDVPEGEAMPGAVDLERLDTLRAEIDLSPETLRDTLETAMAIDGGRPRLAPDGRGRDRLVHPVPAVWEPLVDRTLRQGGPAGPRLALVFDPAHYVRDRGGRPVYVPEPDSRLLHLGHDLYHRVTSTFARYRFPGGPAAATRWTVRLGEVPDGADALVLLTVEELAINELREPCHHWVRTLALPVRGGELGEPLPHRPAAAWDVPPALGDAHAAREAWGEVQTEVKRLVKARQQALTAELRGRLDAARRAVTKLEKERFDRRRKELEKALRENQIERLRKEAAKLRAQTAQLSMFVEEDERLAQRIADLEAEIALRRSHYERVLERLAAEQRRTLEGVLPPRYALRGEARVYPIAVEMRVPHGKD